MTFTPRDVKDVSALVAKKLELYMNQERREDRFDTQGRYRTHPKMRTLDLMYQMLDATEISGKSHRRKHRSTSSKRKDSKRPEEEEGGETNEDSEHGDRRKKRNKERSREKKKKIKPVVINNSLRVVPQNEAERLTDIANKVFEDQDLDKLHVIHRYRPNSRDIAPLTENGKVANYTLHVGSALNSTNYVNYYIKEGLHSSKKECARFQRLQTNKKEDHSQSQHEDDSSPDGRKAQSATNDDTEQPIFNPLIDQSTESLLSTSLMSGSLMPIDKDKPVYTTVFTSTRPSSRGSSDKQSKASSQLNKARMFANGYGYRIVADKHNGFGACDSPIRNESRADIASSEDYCKFLKNNSIDSGRTGDGVDAVVTSNMPFNENELDYNKYQSVQSSILLSGLEDDSRAKSHYHGSHPSSQRSVRSHRSQMSQSSYRSGNSSPIYLDGSMSTCTEESNVYDSEAGPDTARSTSYPISTPGRSKKSYRPIQTLITSKEVPRLGLTSDINDSNGSWNSWTAEEYVTAEEKANMNTDARAREDKKNASQERADDGVLGNSMDARADRSLQKVWNNGDEHQTNNAKSIQNNVTEICDQERDEVTGTDKETALPALSADEAGKEMKKSCPPDEDDKLKQTVPQNAGISQSQVDPNEADSEKEGSLVLLSSRTNKTSIDFNIEAGRPSSRSTSSASKKVKGREKSEAERGEDKVESMELHRGQVPDSEKNKLLKIKIERGDDTPRTMAAKGRLTKSAKKRGMSNYYTMGDEERGLEKEYFAPVEKGFQENYVKATATDDEEDPETPASSRPTSASSCSSRSAEDSDVNRRKPSFEDLLDNGKTDGNRSKSQVEKSIDGRGDDSVSIKSGSIVSAVSSGGKTRNRRHSGRDRDGEPRKGQERSGGQSSVIEPKGADLSGGSRGSRSMHVKLGVGEGYCIEGELLNRGYDEGVLRQSPKGDDDRPSSRASQKSGNNTPPSKSSQRSVKSESETKGLLQDEVSLPREVTAEGILSDTSKHEQSAKKDTSRLEVERHNTVEKITPEADVMCPGALDTKVPEGDMKEYSPLAVNICEGEKVPGHNQSSAEHKENIREHSLTEGIAKISKPSVEENDKINLPEETTHREQSLTEGIAEISKPSLEENDKINLPEETTHRKQTSTEGNAEISKPSMEQNDNMNLPEEITHSKPVSNNQASFEKTESKGADSTTTPIGNEKDALIPSDVRTLSQEIPAEEKAFVDCDLSDNDVVKEAVSGSASMFNEDSDTVIDFRPSSASTAISVGRDQNVDYKKQPIQKPAKIIEVTETESNFGSARESYRSSKMGEDVIHPATKKKRENREQGAILNIADVKLDQVIENGEITHPAMKKKYQDDTTQQPSRSSSLPCTKSNALADGIDLAAVYDKDKKSQSADELPCTHDFEEIKNASMEIGAEQKLESNNKMSEQGLKEKAKEFDEKLIHTGENETNQASVLPSSKPNEETMKDKENEMVLIKDKANTPRDYQQRPKTQSGEGESKQENVKDEEMNVNKSGVEVKSNTYHEIEVNVLENVKRNDELDGEKEKQTLAITDKEKQKVRNKNDTSVPSKEDKLNRQASANALDVMLCLTTDVDLENNFVQGNVVADNISNNLKLNNETPRTPRPGDAVADNRKASEIESKDGIVKESNHMSFEKDRQLEPHRVELTDQTDKDVLESRSGIKALELENKIQDNTKEAPGNVANVAPDSGEKIAKEIQQHLSSDRTDTSRTDAFEVIQQSENAGVQSRKQEELPKDIVAKEDKDETKVKCSNIGNETPIEVAKAEPHRNEIPTRVPEMETKTEAHTVEMKTVKVKVKTPEEATLNTPEAKTRTDQAVVKSGVEMKAEETKVKTIEVGSIAEETDRKTEEEMVKTPNVEPNTDETVPKTPEEEVKMPETEVQIPEVKTKTEATVVKAPEHEMKMKEVKSPEVGIKIEESMVKNVEEIIRIEDHVTIFEHKTDTGEAVVKNIEVETKKEDGVTFSDGDVKYEDTVVKTHEVETKTEYAAVKPSDVRMETNKALENTPGGETKWEEALVTASDVEVKTEEAAVKNPEVKTKSEEVVVTTSNVKVKTDEALMESPDDEMMKEETVVKSPTDEMRTEETVVKASDVETKKEETAVKASDVETKKEETVVKASDVETKKEETVAKASDDDTKREETVVKVPDVETKREETAVNASDVETKREEAVVKAPGDETKKEETVVKASDIETKREETVVKASDIETKREETAVKASDVETKKEETVVKASDVETKKEETVVKAPGDETKKEETVAKASDDDTKREETVVKVPDVETKREETAVNASDVETKREEAVVKAPGDETKKEETVVKASDIETKREETVVKASDVETKREETVVKASDVETKKEETVVKASDVEVKTEELVMKTDEVETKEKETVTEVV